jgi:integrase
VPIFEPLRPTLARLTVGRDAEERLIAGPRGGVITIATLRDATKWDDLAAELGLTGLVRHGLRHTALTWMADAGVELHLQRVAGHQDPAVTSHYLHPTRAVLDAGAAFSRLVVRIRSGKGRSRRGRRRSARSMSMGPDLR